MRLAWFTPWPPQPSGIAGRSAELVRALLPHGFGIDIFVDASAVPAPAAAGTAPAPGELRIQSAHDFVWRAARGQYDLAVYQVGNSRLHGFIWPYLFRWPGLAVLHDARLHHARGRALLSEARTGAYRREFAFSHPDVPPAAAELAVAGFDGPYYYLWPMVRAVLATSRVVAVHARGAVAELRAMSPSTPVEYVALGEGRATPPTPDERRAARRILGLDDDTVVFGVFGTLTADKRVPQILRAFAAMLRRAPHARLLLAGAADPHVDVPALARNLGIGHAIVAAGVLDDEAFDDAVAAVDVSLNLRWPTALETSGPWLRALAAGRPTVTIDLAHQAHVPALDPRDWRQVGGHESVDPVTVAVDILDELHSLTLALDRLAVDTALRARLGAAARRFWESEHTIDRMVGDYRRVLVQAAGAPAPAVAPPDAIRVDPWRHTRTLLTGLGEVSCEFC